MPTSQVGGEDVNSKDSAQHMAQGQCRSPVTLGATAMVEDVVHRDVPGTGVPSETGTNPKEEDMVCLDRP